MEITLMIPDELAAELENGADTPLARRLLELAALAGYQAEYFTRPQLQTLLGFESRFELDGFLKAHGVLFDYAPEQLAREVETLRRLEEARAVKQ